MTVTKTATGMRVSKVRELEQLGDFVKPGDLVALGGAWLCNKPMAAVRQLIRDGIGDLHILTVVGGLEVDLLIAAGLLLFPFLVFLTLTALTGWLENKRRGIENTAEK